MMAGEAHPGTNLQKITVDRPSVPSSFGSWCRPCSCYTYVEYRRERRSIERDKNHCCSPCLLARLAAVPSANRSTDRSLDGPSDMMVLIEAPHRLARRPRPPIQRAEEGPHNIEHHRRGDHASANHHERARDQHRPSTSLLGLNLIPHHKRFVSPLTFLLFRLG